MTIEKEKPYVLLFDVFLCNDRNDESIPKRSHHLYMPFQSLQVYNYSEYVLVTIALVQSRLEE